MITLFHGDDVEQSRAALFSLKKSWGSREVRTLSGTGIDATELEQALNSTSLFGVQTGVIIENLFNRLGKKTKLIELFASIVERSSKTTDVAIWEGKEIGSTIIKKLGKADVRLFKTPTLIFQFLDSLGPARIKYLLTTYQKLEEGQASEITFLMLGRRFRQLLMIADGSVPEGLQSWQLGKLKTQTKLFTVDKLTKLYTQLLEIDFSIKSGSSPFSLSSHIRQFLISL